MEEEKLEQYDQNMQANTVTDEMVYYNVKEEPIRIEGLAFYEKEHEFFRLPRDCKEKVSEAVYWLSSHTAGVQAHFRTNSKKISVKVTLNGPANMIHMPATGQCGIDLYYRLENKKKFIFGGVSKYPYGESVYETTIFESDEKLNKDIILNFPLYMGVKEVLVGLDADATLEVAPHHANSGRVVIYGTSITQGGCASRPGMAFTNILSRKVDMEFINLGFSGSGLGEVEMAEIIKDIPDVRLFILDYEGNGGCTGTLEEHMEEFINTIRTTYPTAPILVMSKPPYSVYELLEKENELRKRVLLFQKNLVKNFRMKKGDMNVYFYDGNNIFGEDDYFECMVDGIHPNDLGFFTMAKTLQPIVKRLLKISNILTEDEYKEKVAEQKAKAALKAKEETESHDEDDDDSEE